MSVQSQKQLKSLASKKEQKSPAPEVRRTFSTEFKRSKVKQIASGLVGVSEVARELGTSRTTVYNWVHLFGNQEKATHVVVQLDSEEQRTKLLRNELHELERVVGRKQMEIDYLNTLIDVSSQELGFDLKKTLSPTPSRSCDSDRSSETGR